MKRMIAVLLALCASAVLAQEYTLGPVEPDFSEPEGAGFATFSWGSTYNYVLTENRKDGYEPIRQPENWIWYTGQIRECRTEYGYHFIDGLLTSGMFYIENSDPHCDEVTFEFISEYSGMPIRLSVTDDGWWVTVFRVKS